MVLAGNKNKNIWYNLNTTFVVMMYDGGIEIIRRLQMYKHYAIISSVKIHNFFKYHHEARMDRFDGGNRRRRTVDQFVLKNRLRASVDRLCRGNRPGNYLTI